MYRTDKAFMRDPATASSRIYVGNLAESVVPDNLEQKFNVHGRILGLVLQRGFGFVQFETEQQAQKAIEMEHGSNFHGKRLNVRQAFDPRKKNQQGNQGQGLLPHPPQQQQHQQQQKAEQEPQMRFEPPAHHEKPPQYDKPPHHEKPPQKEPEKEPEPPAAPIQAKPQQEPPMQNQPPPEQFKMGGGGGKGRKRGPGGRLPPPRPSMGDRFIPPVDDYRDAPPYYGRDDPYAPGFVPPPPLDGPPERNDCEIIVVSKALTEYAEYIEKRLKALGLIVDLLFPNEDVPIGRVLANISSRGCLYAILIMPQNEEHRSLTLDILHGVPQEHRNMPIEDALVLITRNFDAYMRGEQSGVGSATGLSSLSDRHPEAMQMLFNLLAENRQLTCAQYDRLIKYLVQRRDLQSQHEVSEGGDSLTEEPSSKQTELQNRIMNILNKTSEEAPKLSAPPPPTNEAAPTPLLNDPSVQKALDSLLSGDMFKSIGAAL